MPSLKSYITGFALSLVFTALAVLLVAGHVLGGSSVLAALMVLAVAQASVQLIFFMHLGRNSLSNKVIFAFTLSMILAIVVGSIWIMNHLNYNMSPGQMTDYIMKEEGMFR